MTHLHTGTSTLAAAVRLALCSCSLLTAALGIAGTAVAAPGDATRVVVTFKPGMSAQAKAAIAAAKGAVKLELPALDAIAIEVPAAALPALRNNPHFAFVEEDVKRYPVALSSASSAPYLSGQQVPYGVKLVQADQLPDTYAGNRKVCIIDSGYDRAHEDLRLNPAEGKYDRGTGWWYTDENHHGTHVAGTIAAINNSGTGVVGVAAGARLKLHIVKVFSAEGWAYSSSLAAAATECGDAGANVINMSLGGARPSRIEMIAFDKLQAKGVLSVAAAGNGGSGAIMFPAGYPNVLMVGALDENKAWAPFSQYNNKVELSAPGVGVLSTVPMGGATEPALKVGAQTYAPGAMDGSPKVSAAAPLADFGIGDRVNPAVAGKICLIARGAINFATKVSNCQNSGGLGAVVYNNVAGSFGGTLGATVTVIPSVTASDAEGAALKAQLGQSALVAVKATHYGFYDGTSMATPHVAAVAALVWSYFPSCTGLQMRASLTKSALDLGTQGRDDKYGYGLVQAKAAHDRIKARGCGN